MGDISDKSGVAVFEGNKGFAAVTDDSEDRLGGAACLLGFASAACPDPSSGVETVATDATVTGSDAAGVGVGVGVGVGDDLRGWNGAFEGTRDAAACAVPQYGQ